MGDALCKRQSCMVIDADEVAKLHLLRYEE